MKQETYKSIMGATYGIMIFFIAVVLFAFGFSLGQKSVHVNPSFNWSNNYNNREVPSLPSLNATTQVTTYIECGNYSRGAWWGSCPGNKNRTIKQ